MRSAGYNLQMDHELIKFMLAGGLILVFSVFASKATSRFGIPILLIFIIIGMMLGSDGPGGIEFQNYKTAQIVGNIALIYILFSGGLSAPPSIMKPIWKEGVMLASVGVILSMVFMTVLLHYFIGWDWLTSSLLSAAVSSTDAPSVFGILRTQKVQLKQKFQSLVELESGSNDPMAVVILVLLIQFQMHPGEMSGTEMFQSFFIQVALGGLAGWFLGKGLVHFINWLNLDFDGLYPVLTLAGVVCIYSFTEYCGGNGFLSVFVAGLSMAGEKFLMKKSLIIFHDGLSWLMQVGMFLCLGLLVYPSELPAVMGDSAIFAFGLIFLARPLSVVLCLWPLGYRNWREFVFISWGGLKGSVAIILATYLLVAKVPHAKDMFNIIFFTVIISMVLQGFSMAKVCQWLRVCEDPGLNQVTPFDEARSDNEFIEFEIKNKSRLVGHTLFDIHLPENVLVVLIHRDDNNFIPRGNTELRALDRLVCLVNKKLIPEIVRMLEEADPRLNA